MLLDLRIDNARVRTMDPRRPVARSIGVWQGRIVGLDDDVADARAREVVDIRGRTVLPGFVDAHNHLAWAGQAAASLDLSSARTVAEAVQLVAQRAAATAPGAWVDVVGYDQRPFGRHLTRTDLDPVSAGRRVHLIHTSGHAHLVNSVALAQVDADGIRTGGANVVRDAAGAPTGLFLEEATRLVSAVRTPYSVTDLTTALETAGRTCAGQGITFVAEAGIGGGLTARSPLELLAYQNAVDTGQFPLRAQVMVALDAIGRTEAHVDDDLTHAFTLGMRTGFGSDRLSIGATKAWLDGGMMARTAALTEPYLGTGRPARGELSADLDTIAEQAVAAHRAGWQLALHAIGDRAVDAALDIVESAQAAGSRTDARHRIEHCGLVRPDQLPRLAAAGIVAVTQPTFLHAFGDDYAAIMGPDRAGWMYRGRSYLQAGIPLAGSSDRPVTDGAPLRAVQFLVERRSGGGQMIGPDETLSVSEALYAYTMGAAYACRVDDRVGSVTVGKYADLVVLDADPWTVPAAELTDVPIVTTVVGGEPVHGGWPS